MLLVSVADVLRARTISYPQTGDVEAVVATALSNAKAYLGSALSVDFDPTDRVDFFSPLPQSVGKAFRLTSGLIDYGSVVVRVSPHGEILRSAADGEVVVADDCIVDEAAGTVFLLNNYPFGKFQVSVSYQSGFTTGQNGVANNLPQWVKDAAICYANYYLSTASAVPTGKKDKQVMAYASAQMSECHRIIAPHYRCRGMVVWPDRAVVL